MSACVDSALAYANDPKHEGAGYHLRVELETGTVLEGAVHTVGKPEHSLLFLVTSDEMEVFIDKRRVVAAYIIW